MAPAHGAETAADFEAIAGATLARLGYERVCESPRLGVMESLLYRVHERCSFAWYLFRINVIDTVLIKFFGKQPFVDRTRDISCVCGPHDRD